MRNLTALDQRILNAIGSAPGRRAKDIADELKIDRQMVNQRLYGPLKGAVYQDRKYGWHPSKSATHNVQKNLSTSNSNGGGGPDPRLKKLCNYYLDCLGHEDSADVSVFAKTKFGDPQYFELDRLPGLDDKQEPDRELNQDYDQDYDQETEYNIFQAPQAKNLLSKVRRDRSRMNLNLGYPIYLKYLKSSKSDWAVFFVEPLILYPIEIGADSEQPLIDYRNPVLSRKAIQGISGAKPEAIAEIVADLEDELGLRLMDEMPPIDELMQRLVSIRPDWDWQGVQDPYQLNLDAKIAEIDRQGIYNKAILIPSERSPFTEGLESELKILASIPSSLVRGTALEKFLDMVENSGTSKNSLSLLEVLPMNFEQREAVEKGLQSDLAIVTGPPGTGKSQVVTNLLMNCAYQGKKALFASKNNKAVDVVEARVNSFGSRPMLLRLGSNKFQMRLSEYLLSMLSTTPTNLDASVYQKQLLLRSEILGNIERLRKEELSVVDVRNQVDALEQSVESLRLYFKGGKISHLKAIDFSNIEPALNDLNSAFRGFDREKAFVLARPFWRFIKSSRRRNLEKSYQAFIPGLKLMQLREYPDAQPMMDFDRWDVVIKKINQAYEAVVHCRAYLNALDSLQGCRRLEAITKELSRLISDNSANSEALWSGWLRMQSGNLSREDRKKLQGYKVFLEMIIDAGPHAGFAKDIYAKCIRLFSDVSHMLPCWAVTALSARGKVPFEPGFFDVVIFDEASQCDIASDLPLLYRAKRAVVIGDPRQLSHISRLRKGADVDLLAKHELLDNDTRLSYSYNSLFGAAAGVVNQSDIVSLRDHHRSHADIIEFSNKEFYEGGLRVATDYSRLRRPSKDGPGIRWVNVVGKCSRPPSGGAANALEAHAVVAFLEDLLVNKGYSGTIGVVSPFRSQANLIRDLVFANETLTQALSGCEFLVDTVHKFQGDERDIMLFSPVVSVDVPAGAIAFLRNNGNLFNVAITRARAHW